MRATAPKKHTFLVTGPALGATVIMVAATACSTGGSGIDGDAGAGDASSGTGAASSKTSCNLAADLWMTDCKNGCGDVMNCISICKGCPAHCRVQCSDQPGQPIGPECDLAGAGACSHSTYGTDFCGAPPTKCPGPRTGSGSGSGTGSGSGSGSGSSSGS